jgi:hypothetical protein
MQNHSIALRNLLLIIYPVELIAVNTLEHFRNYCGLIKIARCGFLWQKTTRKPVASVYTNCETAYSHGSHAWAHSAPAMMLSAPIDPASTQVFLQNLDHHHGQVVCLWLFSCKGGNGLGDLGDQCRRWFCFFAADEFF